MTIRYCFCLIVPAALIFGPAAIGHAEPVDGPWTNAVGFGSGPIFGGNTASPTVGDGSTDSAAQEMIDSPFTPITLNSPGDKIVFTGSVTLSGTGNHPANIGNPRTQFRFGLFDADADDFGWAGYYMSNRHGDSSGAAGVLARKPVGNTSAYLSTGGQNGLASIAGDSSAASLFHDGMYDMSMTIERNSTNGLLISSTLMRTTGFMQTLSATDTTAAASGTYTFDSLGFLLGNNLGTDLAVFENLEVSFVPAHETLTLQVLAAGPNAGAMRMVNKTTESQTIEYYEITSAAGSLDPAGWQSLDDQDPVAPPLGWGEAAGADDQLLSEALIVGAEPIAPGSALLLGQGFTGAAEDLEFFVGLSDGSSMRGAVEYILPGDFDADGSVTAADLAEWKRDVGQNGYSDADFDGDSDGADFLSWQRNLGTSSGLAAMAAIPEPSALALLGFAGLFACGNRRYGMGRRGSAV